NIQAMRPKLAAISGSTTRPLPASHAPRPAKDRPTAMSGAAQQIATRTAPAMPTRIAVRSLILAAPLPQMGWIARVHAGDGDDVGVRLCVVEGHGRCLCLEGDGHIRDARDCRHR